MNKDDVAGQRISINGYFPSITKDSVLRKYYSDIKMGYGYIDVMGVDEEKFKEILSEMYKDESQYKVIGVYDIDKNGNIIWID